MKLYRRYVEITEKDEMHIVVDHYLELVTLPDEEEIEKMFPFEQSKFMFKASESYNKAQQHRREGAKAITALIKGEER